MESCSFCWNRSLSTWFCRSSSKTRFFSLMHSSRRSWPGCGGVSQDPWSPSASSQPPDTFLAPTFWLSSACTTWLATWGGEGRSGVGHRAHAASCPSTHVGTHVGTHVLCAQGTQDTGGMCGCSPVPHPGSVHTSPAGSHWPGPGLSSLPRTEQGQLRAQLRGQLRGHRGHPRGTKQTLCLLGRGTQGHTWQDGATPGAVAYEGREKLGSVTHHHGVRTVAPWHRPQLALGTGCTVATAAWWHLPQLPSGPVSWWCHSCLPPAPAGAAAAHGWCPSRPAPLGSRLPAPRPRSPTSLLRGTRITTGSLLAPGPWHLA